MFFNNSQSFISEIIFSISCLFGIEDTAYFLVTPTDATLFAIFAERVISSPLASIAQSTPAKVRPHICREQANTKNSFVKEKGTRKECTLYGNLPPLTSSLQERTRQCCEPMRLRRWVDERTSRQKRDRHSQGVPISFLVTRTGIEPMLQP